MPNVNRSHLTRVITFLNDKGGVFKTSTTANVGGLLAASGYKTLLIDLDPQGNLALDLGYQDDSDDGENLFLALRRDSRTPLSPLTEVRPNLDVIPGGTQLADLSVLLNNETGASARNPLNILAQALVPIAGEYDFVLIDTPPKVPTLQNLALGAARWLIIPTQADEASRQGLVHVVDLFKGATEANPDLELLGVVMVGISISATRIRREVRNALIEDFGGEDYLFQATLRTSESSAYEARRQGSLIFELESQNSHMAGRSGGLAQDYQALTSEIVTRMADAETMGEE